LQEDLLERFEPAEAPDALGLWTARWNVAAARAAAGDEEGARALLQAVVDDLERRNPEGHPDLPAAWTNLALCESACGGAARAIELQRRALAVLEETRPPDDPATLRARACLAGFLVTAGDVAAAAPHVTRLEEGV